MRPRPRNHRRPSRTCAAVPRGRGFEALEPRWLLTAGLNDVISVGRFLSVASAHDLQNHELKLTYTVFNQQVVPVDGLSLSTTLQSGVTLVSASLAPVQMGGNLSWSLGTLAPLASQSIEITVSLADPLPLQLDAGAHAAGIVGGMSVADDASAAVLRADAIDTNLLRSTADANTSDPFILAKAAELDQDPIRIFQFLTREVGYESYLGSLRGARGTLWSTAGNSLDEASLGVALMRASGIPAQYAHGVLSDDQARTLIVSMFPDPTRISGLIPAGAVVGDPAHDPKLLAETREHFWLQFDAGAGLLNADTSFANAALGQTFTAVADTFAEVPDALRHKLTLKLDRELANTASALFGGGASLDRSTVLTATFNTLDLVGRPLSLGHFVQQDGLSAPVFSLVTNTYSPYLMLGDAARSSATDQLIRGTDYQETLTNFPFGSRILTGLFLTVEISGPDGPTETFERALVDRIGFDIRQHGGTPNLTAAPDQRPTLSDLDFFTLSALPARLSRQAGAMLARDLANDQTLLDSLTNADGTLAPGGQAVQQRISLGLSRFNAANYFLDSDLTNASLPSTLFIRAYFDRPRLVITSTRVVVDDVSHKASLAHGIDLQRDTIRALAYPGQNLSVVPGFHYSRGVADSIIEGEILQMALGAGGASAAASAATILAQAKVLNIPLAILSGTNALELDSLSISNEAKARISLALSQGLAVIVPRTSVPIGGIDRIGWLEIHLDTGITTGVLEDGSHGAIVEYAAVFALGGLIGSFIAGRIGLSLSDFPLGCYATDQALKECIRNHPGANFPAVNGILNGNNLFLLAILPISITIAYIIDVGSLAAALSYQLDPPLPDYWVAPSAANGLTPLTGVGRVLVGIVPDPLFTLPLDGALLPTVFRVGIKNQGAAARRFRLDIANPPIGFDAITSVPELLVGAGQTVEVGLVLRPTAGLPLPGTHSPFSVSVTQTDDLQVTATETEDFVVPEIHSLTMVALPAVPSTTPGTNVSTKLVLTSRGNVMENVQLQADLSSGLALTGLMNVTLNPGETKELLLTLTPSAETPLNSTLDARISADFGTAAPVTAVIPVHVRVPGATAIDDAALNASQLGNLVLAARLNDLAIEITHLVRTPESLVFKSQTLASLDAVVVQLQLDAQLAALAGPILLARADLADAITVAQIQASLITLGNTLDALSQFLTDLVQHGFQLSLLNNAQVARPQNPVDFQLVLRNTGTLTTTYSFAFDSVPTGFEASFSQPSITLAPGEVSPGLGIAAVIATLTSQSTAELAAANVPIRVTAREAPSVTRVVMASLTARREFVSVVSVSSDPPFTEPGSTVNISTRVLNAVNELQTARASFEIRDSNQDLVFMSANVDVMLGVVTSLATIALGPFDTTGLLPGEYTILVSLVDQQNHPIPGATGQGRLLVGSPVSAALVLDPQVLPSGTASVQTTLEIAVQGALPPTLGLVGVGAASAGQDVARLGNLVYLARSSGISVFDVADPTNPQLVRTFGGAASNLEIHGDRLVALRGVTAGGAQLSIYSLAADPVNPTLLGSTPTLPYHGLFDLLVTDTHAYVGALQFLFLGSANNADIVAQSGDLLSIDISDPMNPFLADVLVNTFGTNNDGVGVAFGVDQSGGPFNVFNVEQVNATTLYLATTTSQGGNPNLGVGRIRVVDISNPGNMTVLDAAELQIPGTVQIAGMAIEGQRAFVLASSGGWTEPDISRGLSGSVVLATLDISDARHPQLVQTQTLPLRSRGIGATFEHVGNQLYAFGGLGDPDDPQITLVNTVDPLHPATLGTSVSELAVGLLGGDGIIYTADSSGLKVYEIGNSNPVDVTAEVQIPNGTGVAIDLGSFDLPPTSIISGIEFDTLLWNLSLSDGLPSRTISWATTVSNLQPGETRAVTLDATITFTSNANMGQVTLPAQHVLAEQILGLAPAERTTRPGESAAFTLHVANPTSIAQGYSLSIQGLPAAWSNLPAFVGVSAHGTVDVPFALTSEATASLASYGFVVTANSLTGALGSVQGMLTLAGEPVLPEADSRGVLLTVTPIQATAGQVTATDFVLRIVNTGGSPDTFVLFNNLPAGFVTTFDQNLFEVLPGASNFRDVTMHVAVPAGTPSQDYPFLVTVASATHANMFQDAQATLAVVAYGVTLALAPRDTAAGSTLDLLVTNTGSLADTFDLALAGPAALVSRLGASSVMLDPGESQLVSVTTSAVDFALPGGLNLIAAATSRGNTAVRAVDQATLSVAPSRGVRGRFLPGSLAISPTATADAFLRVDNLGNLEEGFQARIVRVEGPLAAHLMGFDGQPTQLITLFLLPGLQGGALQLQTTALQAGHGSVTVEIASTDGRVVGQATLPVTVMGTVQALPDVYCLQDAGAGPVSVAAPGVLINDGAGAMLAALSRPAALGTVVVRADGSFTYSPGPGFSAAGIDTFEYTIGASGESMSSATVTVESEYHHFVSNLYRDLLNREGEQDGKAFWIGSLLHGESRANVIDGFLRSREYLENQVRGFYSTLLKRTPTQPELDDARARLLGGELQQSLLARLAAHADYQALGATTDAQFLDQLYHDLLGRAVDASGLDFWTRRLRETGSRQRVALEITFSDEFEHLLIDEPAAKFLGNEGWYADYLHRNPEPSGRDYWFARLDATHHWRDIQLGILGSAEYYDCTDAL